MEYSPTKTYEHHVLWPRRLFNAYEETKILRHRKGLIIPVLGEYHFKPGGLHGAIESMPVPSLPFAKAINREFYPVKKDPIATLENLIEAIMEASAELDPYTKAMGEAMVMGLEIQLPFIEASERQLHG